MEDGRHVNCNSFHTTKFIGEDISKTGYSGPGSVRGQIHVERLQSIDCCLKIVDVCTIDILNAMDSRSVNLVMHVFQTQMLFMDKSWE